MMPVASVGVHRRCSSLGQRARRKEAGSPLRKTFAIIRAALIASFALLLTACATTPTAPDNSATIDYTVTPCFGFCPSFELSVTAEGDGTYEGQAFVARRGEASFMASDAEYQAFARRLAPYRPKESVSYGHDNCDGPVATDSPSVKITWRDPGEQPVTLYWYMGCRQPGLTENSEALYKAWQELPVDDLVGDDEDRQGYDRF